MMHKRMMGTWNIGLLLCSFVVIRIATLSDNNLCSIHANAYSSKIAMPLTNNIYKRCIFRSSSQTKLYDAASPVANDILAQEYSTRSTNSFFDVKYDAQSILDYYDRRPFDVGLRLNMLGLPLLGWYFGLVMDKVLKIEDDENVERKRGEELRMHLVRSKSVALIKTGQALSLRPDILKSKIWAEELGKLVDEVDSCPDIDAMNIMREELSDLLPRIKNVKRRMETTRNRKTTRLNRLVESDPILQMFDFDNDCRVVASASIGQVYKAKIRPGPVLEAAIGKIEAARWGGKTVAIKIQRPDVAASAALDMYLIRRTAVWLSMFRGGDIVALADTFNMQLFDELDYVREANNCERFRKLYGKWDDVVVPASCAGITRKKVLVMDWVEGTKGPWMGPEGIDMVRIGLRCSTDQLLRTGLFHSDPHRGNLLRTRKVSNDIPGTGQLALGVIDFGMMSDIPESDRYGLIGLVLGLKNRDLALATENLLKLGFLDDTTQVDVLVPRLRKALKNATGGTNKASELSFSQLQIELDTISRDNLLKFKIPPYIFIIIRSLTILEGFALDVDPNFRLIRGAYPYVLKQLLSPESEFETPKALDDLLVRLLTVNGEGKVINWSRLRDLLVVAEKASKKYDPSKDNNEDKVSVSRKTIDLLLKFMTSKTGLFLKEPLIHELAEAIDGMASMGESNLLRLSRGLIRPLPGGNGPINTRRMDEMKIVASVLQSALVSGETKSGGSNPMERLESAKEFAQGLLFLLREEQGRAAPLLAELFNVIQLVAVEVLEIRSSRAIRGVLGIATNELE